MFLKPTALVPSTVQLLNVPLDGVPNAPPVEYLPLNVFQSVDVKYPLTLVVAAAIDIAGVAPPLDTTGAVPVTLATVPLNPPLALIDPVTETPVDVTATIVVPPLCIFKFPLLSAVVITPPPPAVEAFIVEAIVYSLKDNPA